MERQTSREFDPFRDQIATQAATIEHLRQMLASANRYNDRLTRSRKRLLGSLVVALATVAILLLAILGGR